MILFYSRTLLESEIDILGFFVALVCRPRLVFAV